MEEQILAVLCLSSGLMEDLQLTGWCPIEHSLGNAALNSTVRPQLDVTAGWPSMKWVDPQYTGIGECGAHHLGLVWTIDGSPDGLRQNPGYTAAGGGFWPGALGPRAAHARAERAKGQDN